MQAERRTLTILINAAIFILLEIAAVAMLRSSSTLQDVWINRSSHRVMAALWSGGESLRNHFHLEEQNSLLAEENFRLSEELRAYKAAAGETAEKEAAASGSGNGFRYIPATVVKISRNSAHNYIIVNKGSEDGITPQSGIITDRGIVGIVKSVGKHYSYGLTLMNSNVSVGSRISRLGIVAPLSWDGRRSDTAILRDVAAHYDIEPGDTVCTSGFSTIFPPDVPVGTVRSTRIIDGSTKQSEVGLFQNFRTLRYVTIVENIRRSEIEALEKAEEDGI